MIKKSVLCYGDSITWGYNPVNQKRMLTNERWTGVLADCLGKEYTVIEEGLNGRTTVLDDPTNGGYKNGLKYLIPCLNSHKPIDLCIVLLGTNDMKKRFSLSAMEIARGMKLLIEAIKKSDTGHDGKEPEILLLTPPYVNRSMRFSEEFKDAYSKAQELPEYYAQIAKEFNCEFLDTSKLINVSELDGVHPDLEEHFKLGNAVASMVKEII